MCGREVDTKSSEEAEWGVRPSGGRNRMLERTEIKFDQCCVAASAPPFPPGILRGMPREVARGIYRAGEETIVRVVVELSA